MTAAVPALTPPTMPDTGVIVATVTGAQLQVPPVVASVSDVRYPTHTEAVPLIAAGSA